MKRVLLKLNAMGLFCYFTCKWYFAANLFLAILKLNIFSYGYGFILSWPIIKRLNSSYAFLQHKPKEKLCFNLDRDKNFLNLCLLIGHLIKIWSL